MIYERLNWLGDDADTISDNQIVNTSSIYVLWQSVNFYAKQYLREWKKKRINNQQPTRKKKQILKTSIQTEHVHVQFYSLVANTYV